MEQGAGHQVPNWLEWNPSQLSATVKSVPVIEDVPFEVNLNLIIEFIAEGSSGEAPAANLSCNMARRPPPGLSLVSHLKCRKTRKFHCRLFPSQPGAPALRGSSSSFPSLPTQLRRPVTFGEVLYAATPSAYVTKALIAANVLVYVLMVARGISRSGRRSSKLLAWGAGYGPLTTNGQPWRLFTGDVPAFGIIHIGMNMFVLWQGGALIERLFGNFSYLVIYLLSGLCGSFLSLYTHPFGVSAGASGAVFGVYGALFATWPFNVDRSPSGGQEPAHQRRPFSWFSMWRMG